MDFPNERRGCRYADVVVHRLLEAALRLDAPPVLFPHHIQGYLGHKKQCPHRTLQ